MTIEIVKDIGGYAGAFVTIIGLVVMIVKPIREKLIGWVNKVTNKEVIEKKLDGLTALVERSIVQNDELKADMHIQNEALKANIRNSILNIYHIQINKGYMTTFDLCNLTELHESYKQLGGNSFIHKCVEQLEELPVNNGGEDK